jgi:inosose dehydratase
VTVRLATGPVSWGVDFAGAPCNPPYAAVLDGAVAAGFRWLELGPLGYLPATAAPELAARGLGITAGFVFEPLHDPGRLADVLAAAEATAVRVADAGGRFLVVIDAVSPRRAATAGRSGAAPRLRGRAHDALLRALDAVAEAARARGLRPVVHPHAGTHVEFVDEIEPLVEVAELCLDTGHLAYAGIDPVAAFREWAGRVPYLHLKDFDPAHRAGDFWASVRAGAFRPLGEGVVDLPALAVALAEHGYDGWAVVEQDRDLAVPGDPVADLIASRRHAERTLNVPRAA